MQWKVPQTYLLRDNYDNTHCVSVTDSHGSSSYQEGWYLDASIDVPRGVDKTARHELIVW